MTYTTKQKSRRAQLQKARQKRCFHRRPAEPAEPDPSSQLTNQQGPATSTAGLATPSEAQHHHPGPSVDAATPLDQQHTREPVQQHAAHLLHGSLPLGASHIQRQPLPHPNIRHQLLSRYALTDPPPPQSQVYPAQHLVPPALHARIPAVAVHQQQQQSTIGLQEHTLHQQVPSPQQQQHTLQDSDPSPQQLLPSPQHLSPEQEPPRKQQRPNPALPAMPTNSEPPGTHSRLGGVPLGSSCVQVEHHTGSYVPAAAAALLAGHATSPPPPPTVLQLLQPPPGVSAGTRNGFQVAAKAAQSLLTPGGRHARAGINCSNADRAGPSILATRDAPISGIRHLAQQQKVEQQAAEIKRLQQQVTQQQQQIKAEETKLFIMQAALEVCYLMQAVAAGQV